MAASNLTGTPVVQSFGTTQPCASELPELEKISCSLALLSEAELLDLRGKRIRVLQSFRYQSASQFTAQVMAVNLPLSGFGFETSVLLRQDGHSVDYLDYVDVSHLTLLEVLQ